MDRHVIKGRGENRGKYLCYSRMAPELTPTKDGFVWLPDQRKAARWDDPRFNKHTWGTARASLHNGYFVRLVAPKAITQEVVRELRAFIAERAAGAKDPLPCHWFGGDFHDAGEDFCWECAKKLVDKKYAEDPKRFTDLFGEQEDDAERYRVAIDGGFDTDHDSLPYCGTCGAKLSGYLTEYGADEEIDALTNDCSLGVDDVENWDALDRAIMNLSYDDPRWRKIARVVAAAQAECAGKAVQS